MHRIFQNHATHSVKGSHTFFHASPSNRDRSIPVPHISRTVYGITRGMVTKVTASNSHLPCCLFVWAITQVFCHISLTSYLPVGLLSVTFPGRAPAPAVLWTPAGPAIKPSSAVRAAAAGRSARLVHPICRQISGRRLNGGCLYICISVGVIRQSC